MNMFASKLKSVWPLALALAMVGVAPVVRSQWQNQWQPQNTFTIQRFALQNRCSSAQRERMWRCEEEWRYDWNIRDTDYYSHTRKFCCFVWDTLSCQLRIAQRCDPTYAATLSSVTEQTYSSMCEYYSRRSASCALRWWSIALIVLAVIAALTAAIAVVFYALRSRRQKRSPAESATDYEKVPAGQSDQSTSANQ